MMATSRAPESPDDPVATTAGLAALLEAMNRWGFRVEDIPRKDVRERLQRLLAERRLTRSRDN